jgi:hypothetical protein
LCALANRSWRPRDNLSLECGHAAVTDHPDRIDSQCAQRTLKVASRDAQR